MRYLYSFLITLLIPFAILRLYYKSLQNPNYRKRIAERLALLPQSNQAVIWFHTVSVGEFLATKNLIQTILQENLNHHALITCTTPTASTQIQRYFSKNSRCTHYYLPFDQPFLCRQFLKKTNPKIALFVETEIWPNWLHYTKKSGIPSLLINARLSEKSYQSYRKLGQFSKETIAQFSLVACQNKSSCKRFKALSANAQTVGNLKFDIKAPDDLVHFQKNIKQLGINDFYIAASTHDPEEAIILKTHQLYQSPSTLIIAPRHPERSNQILSLCEQMGIIACKKSNITNNTQKPNVIILDTLGELIYFYSLAQFAIIGGSFNQHGGHNPLEAALFSTPCIIGPSYFNFKDMINEMQSENAILVCPTSDPNDILIKINQLIDSSDIIANNSYQYLKKHQGTITKLSQMINNQINP